MFNCSSLGEASGAAGVDVDHGVIVSTEPLRDDLRGLCGQNLWQDGSTCHLCGVSTVQSQPAWQIIFNLTYCWTQNNLSTGYSNCVTSATWWINLDNKQYNRKSQHLHLFKTSHSFLPDMISAEKMTALLLMTVMVCCRDSCLRLLLIKAGRPPIMDRPIQ